MSQLLHPAWIYFCEKYLVPLSKHPPIPFTMQQALQETFFCSNTRHTYQRTPVFMVSNSFYIPLQYHPAWMNLTKTNFILHPNTLSSTDLHNKLCRKTSFAPIGQKLTKNPSFVMVSSGGSAHPSSSLVDLEENEEQTINSQTTK